MKRIILSAALAVFACTLVSAQTSPRTVVDFDFDWRFARIDDEAGPEIIRYDDSSWESVQCPHDWNIKDSFDDSYSGSAAALPSGTGWYRKDFTVPSSMSGKSVEIVFDGIFQCSDVWINGHHLGSHPYGYTTVTSTPTAWRSPIPSDTV